MGSSRWWRGRRDDDVGVEVDARGPGVTVTVEDALTRTAAEVDTAMSGPKVYRKDETALIRVEAGEASDFSAVLVAPGASLGSGCGGGCQSNTNCRCCRVNLATTALNALRGSVGFSVTGVRDVYSNVAQAADGGIEVTRWKWGRTVPDNLSVRAAPALDSSGRLYAGAINADNGNVYRFGLKGEVVTFIADAGAVQGIAVAETWVSGGRQEVVYLAANTPSGGDLWARNVDGGTTGLNSVNCAFFSSEIGPRPTYTAVALFDAGTTAGGCDESSRQHGQDRGAAACVRHGVIHDGGAARAGPATQSTTGLVYTGAGANADWLVRRRAGGGSGGRLAEPVDERGVAKVAAHGGQCRHPGLSPQPRLSLKA